MKRFLLLLLLLPVFSFAQPVRTTHTSQLWLHGTYEARITNKFTAHLNGGWRTIGWFEHPSLWFIRPGIIYIPNKQVQFQAGITHFEAYNIPLRVFVPEWRPYLFATVQGPTLGKVKLQHRYRAEWRNFRNTDKEGLAPGYFNYGRIGYMLTARYPLKISGKQRAELRVFDELMMNIGGTISTTRNFLDQNRSFVGAYIPILGKTLEFDAEYCFIVQQRPVTKDFTPFNDVDMFRFTLVVRNDFRKNKEAE